MPDVSINDLPSASSMSDSGLLVVYQNSQTQSVTGQKVKSYAAEAATEIAEPVAAAAVEDKFDDMTVSATTLSPGSQATATYDPETNALALGIPRGQDGQGAGDMTKSVYDPDEEVYDAGGIPAYVESSLGDKIDDPSTKENGQVLTYNGTSWEAADPSGGMIAETFTATLSSNGWSLVVGLTNVYANAIDVQGMQASYSVAPTVDLNIDVTNTSQSAWDTAAKAFGKIASILTHSGGGIRAYVYGTPPTVNLPIIINTWR